MSESPFEIGVFQVVLPIGAERRGYQADPLSRVHAEPRVFGGALGAVLANAGVVAVLLGGITAPSEQIKAHAVTEPGELVARIIDIDLRPDAPVPADALSLSSMNVAPPIHVEELPHPRLDVAVNDAARQNADPVEPVVLKDDAEESERLRGIYAQQIVARIARTLEAHGLAGAGIDCTVALTQSREIGKAQFEFTDCDRDSGWRERIIIALRDALPLPLPPREDLYSPTLVVKISNGVVVQLPPEPECGDVAMRASGCAGDAAKCYSCL